MGEAALVVGDADDGLRERLDAEINAFNTVLRPNGPSCVNDANGNAVTRR